MRLFEWLIECESIKLYIYIYIKIYTRKKIEKGDKRPPFFSNGASLLNAGRATLFGSLVRMESSLIRRVERKNWKKMTATGQRERWHLLPPNFFSFFFFIYSRVNVIEMEDGSPRFIISRMNALSRWRNPFVVFKKKQINGPSTPLNLIQFILKNQCCWGKKKEE